MSNNPEKGDLAGAALVQLGRGDAFDLADKGGHGDSGRDGRDQMNMLDTAVQGKDGAAQPNGFGAQQVVNHRFHRWCDAWFAIFGLPDQVVKELTVGHVQVLSLLGC